MALLRCPTCDRLFDVDLSPAMPFCSARCRLVDLGRWLGEENSVPHEGSRDDDEAFDVFAPGDEDER